MRTSLYRLFGEDDVLLYVGISNEPMRRFSQHCATKDTKGVRSIAIEWFDDTPEAMRAESIAISSERPLWNRKSGRPKINYEQVPARFPAGTLAAVDAVLTEGEKRADFLREAVSREVDRREAASQDKEQK